MRSKVFGLICSAILPMANYTCAGNAYLAALLSGIEEGVCGFATITCTIGFIYLHLSPFVRLLNILIIIALITLVVTELPQHLYLCESEISTPPSPYFVQLSGNP